MAAITAIWLVPLVSIVVLTSVVLSFAVFARWERRRRRHRAANLWANPVAWRRYWLTNSLVGWVVSVVNTLALYLLGSFTLPMPHSAAFSSILWRIGGALVVGITIGHAIRVTQAARLDWEKARRQSASADAHPDDAAPPP